MGLLDHSTLASKNVLTMSQNEILDCILTRLEDLESSQTRTSLRVRVLTQRLMRQKQKQLLANRKAAAASRVNSSSSLENKPPVSIVPPQLQRKEPQEEEPTKMDTKEGEEDEAILLVSMRDITQIPYDPCTPLQTLG